MPKTSIEKVTLTSDPDIEIHLTSESNYSIALLRFGEGDEALAVGASVPEITMNLIKTLRAGDVIQLFVDEQGSVTTVALVERKKRD